VSVRRAGCLLLSGVFCVAAPRTQAWGPGVHQAVTGRAIDTLPGGLKTFYRTHRLELPTLSLEPNFPEEGPERRFAIDHVMPFPFLDFPTSEAAVKARFGEAGAEIGRLPWLTLESYSRLVDAFKSRDKGRILEESDTLASLLTDLHNPLALTENADGQKSEQNGLWVRFSVKLPEAMGGRLKLSPDAAAFLDDPKGYVFDIVRGSYVWADNVLYLDEIAHRGKSGYTEIYYEFLELRAGEVLKARLSVAAREVGSYWYTAWTAAGRPELK